MGNRQTTLVEVAKHAGVSLATASRVLNGSTRQVSAALREKVLASAAELGYLPNASAQALARNTSVFVGLLISDLTDPFAAGVAAGVTGRVERSGLVVVLGTTGRDTDRELSLMASLRAHRARAVIIVDGRSTEDHLTPQIEAYAHQGGRVVAVGGTPLSVDTIAVDDFHGAVALAETLVSLGHRRFGVLAGPPDSESATRRLTGFRAGLATAGITVRPEDVVHGESTRDGGHRAVGELDVSALSCLFAVNDGMATGAVTALTERGLAVPSTISVAGFGDYPCSADLGLTTARIPLADIGATAADLALRDRTHTTTQVLSITPEIIIRTSTSIR